MLDDAALALEEIEPEDRRSESIEKAEAILLRARAIHPKVTMIQFNLACCASVTGRMEDAKERLRHAIEL
jgi:Flp pilus assembly protein TadD